MNRGAVLLLLLGVALSGCSMSASADNAGGFPPGTGSGGISGAGNSTGSAPPLTTPMVVAVEIDPPTSSPSAVTQILERDISTADLYETSPAVTVVASFGAATGGSVPSSSDVVLVVPPTIPGRPDLSFQSVGASLASGQSVTAMLVVPQDAIGAASTLSLVPLPPADQTMPSYSFSMPVSAMMAYTLPGDDVVVPGQIQLANQVAPRSTFVARAFQGGSQVSDSAPTQADGTFQIRLPASAAANPVTLQLSPAAPSGSAPQDAWFVSNPPITVTAGKSLGVITMPSYGSPVTYDIVVASGSAGIASVNVRAQATLGSATVNGSSVGTATYVSNGGTDMSGMAALSFLPAIMNASMSNAPVQYTVTATPPIGSAYATKCSTTVTPLGGSGSSSTGTPMTIANLKPDLRPILTGTVWSASHATVSGVTVTASGTPDPSDPGCPTPAAVTASTTTDMFGVFSLPLDPGTYQLDYDPPAGSSVPRMTEYPVAVPSTDGSTAHDVFLPAGALVTGTVVGRTDGMPVGSATVRFFLPLCSGQSECFGPMRKAPALVGKALTGSDGKFRMIVAVPSSS